MKDKEFGKEICFSIIFYISLHTETIKQVAYSSLKIHIPHNCWRACILLLSIATADVASGLSELGSGLCLATAGRESGLQGEHRQPEAEPAWACPLGQCEALRPARHSDAASLTHRGKSGYPASCEEEDSHLRSTAYRCESYNLQGR